MTPAAGRSDPRLGAPCSLVKKSAEIHNSVSSGRKKGRFWSVQISGPDREELRSGCRIMEQGLTGRNREHLFLRS